MPEQDTPETTQDAEDLGTATTEVAVDEEQVDADIEPTPTEDIAEETPEPVVETPPPAPRPVVTGQAAATGRRKEAVARVRVSLGGGAWTINGRSLEQYFPNKVHQQVVLEPLRTVGRSGQFDVIARIHGGGVTGQAGALRLGLARALTEIDPEDRSALKKAGLLTRDPRVKERKKYGLKKARKAPQYSKR